MNFLKEKPTIDFLNARCIGFYKEELNYDLYYHDKSSPLLEYLTNPKLNTNEQIKECFARGYNPLAHGLMCYRPETLKKLGGFSKSDVKLDGLSPDFETWRKAINAGYKFYRLPELLMQWRLDSSSIRK
jgi:GT2 family glycosyltransferase